MQIDDQAVRAQKKSKQSPVGSGSEQCEAFGVVMCVQEKRGATGASLSGFAAPSQSRTLIVWWVYSDRTLRHFGVETYILGMIAFHNRMIVHQPLRAIGFQVGGGKI